MMSEEMVLKYVIHRTLHKVETQLADVVSDWQGFVRANVQKSMLFQHECVGTTWLLDQLQVRAKRALRRYTRK